ncbi:MAG: hypothetical protein M1820_009098 [Bogoriella megaspora]|nr:MAG: hypothetical protein M1820_009098 [Bogoriella megaspora]
MAASPAVTAAPSRTILAPLTTVFTPPPSCTSLFNALVNDTISSDGGFTSLFGPPVLSIFAAQGVKCNSTFDFVADDTDILLKLGSVVNPLGNDFDCWPPATQSSLTSLASLRTGAGFYSPGLLCPSGYTTACTAQGMNNTLVVQSTLEKPFNFQFPLLPDETAAGCCPTGFGCWVVNPDGVNYQTCVSQAIGGSITTHQCYQVGGSHSLAVSTTTVTLPAPMTWTSSGDEALPESTTSETVALTNSAATTYTSNFPVVTVLAPMIQLNYKASDLTLATSTATNSSTSNTREPKQESPATEIMALGIAVPIAAIAIAALLATFFFYRRRHRRFRALRQNGQAYEKPELEALSATVEVCEDLQPKKLPACKMHVELGNAERYELASPDYVHEMGSSE